MKTRTCPECGEPLTWDAQACEWLCSECCREEAEANHRQACEEAFDSELDLESEIDFQELENLPF